MQLANGAGAVCDDPVSMLKYNRLTYAAGKTAIEINTLPIAFQTPSTALSFHHFRSVEPLPHAAQLVECMIPVHLKYQIESLESRLKASGHDQVKIALFDLDNTLLIGDIGEAVFARLLADGAPLKCTWEEYQSFLRCDVSAAYRLVVESMAGLTVREVEEATMKILKQPAPFIKAGNAHVPVPKPHPGMKKLVVIAAKAPIQHLRHFSEQSNLRSNCCRRILRNFSRMFFWNRNKNSEQIPLGNTCQAVSDFGRQGRSLS